MESVGRVVTVECVVRGEWESGRGGFTPSFVCRKPSTTPSLVDAGLLRSHMQVQGCVGCVVRGWRSPVSLRARPPQRVQRRCASMASQGQAAGGVTREDTLITFDVDGTLIEATGPDANQVSQHPERVEAHPEPGWGTEGAALR